MSRLLKYLGFLLIGWLVIIFYPIGTTAATGPEDDISQIKDYKYYRIIEERNIFKPWKEAGVKPTPPLVKVNTSGVFYSNMEKQYLLIVVDPEKNQTSQLKVGDTVLGKKILKIELDHIILLLPNGKEEKIIIGDSITEEKPEEK